MISKIINLVLKNFLLKKQNERIIKFLPEKFNTIVDIGTHHGELYSSLNKKSIKFDKYFMFEPLIDSFNVIDKIQDTRVTKFNLAISSQDGKKEFALNPLKMTSSFSEVNQNLIKFKVKKLLFKGKTIKKVVETKKLDNFEFESSENNFLKIDTEGHELEVLYGSSNHLKKGTFKYLLLEIQKPNTYKQYDPNHIYDYLDQYSYIALKEFKVPLFGFSDVLFVQKLHD